MRYYKLRSTALLAEYDDCTMDIFLRMYFSNQKSNVKFQAPKWYSTEIKENSELNLKEITKNEYEQLLNKDFNDYRTIDFDNADIELYHGTDAKMIRMSKDERQMHKSYCEQAIEYLYPLFKAKFYNGYSGDYWGDIDKASLDKETAHYIKDVLDCYRSMLRGNIFFQYPDGVLFLTSDSTTAEDYARRNFAGGEFGYLAYFMCKAASILFPDIKPDKESSYAIKHVLEFGNKKREPIVIPVTNINLEFFRNEAGQSILEYDYGRYRYSGPIELDLSKATFRD